MLGATTALRVTPCWWDEAKKSVLFEKVLITTNCHNPIRKERKNEILIKKLSNVKALIVS